MAELGIWEPLAVKAQTYKTAVEVYTLKAYVSSLILLCIQVMDRKTVDSWMHCSSLLSFSTDS